MAYPYGIGADETPGSLTWARRHEQALPAYLNLPVRVYVGTQDTDRDDSLRQESTLDDIQGLTRVARAETYVARFRAAARLRGIRLPGVTHDVAQAIRQTDLARLVTADVADAPALAS
jgi:hypothetical protein